MIKELKNKQYVGELSPGCQRCFDDSWSCFFFTFECPASCFFCKNPHPIIKSPFEKVTGLEFKTVDDYAKFIKKTGITGVSISGGDPLVDVPKLINYISAIRELNVPNMYIWAYTSGILMTEEIAEQLNNAGLDEMRFNIASCNYNLSFIKKAKAIKTLTVEIPCIPEDVEKFKILIPDLIDSGVKHVNFHELTLHSDNSEALRGRDYIIADLRVIFSGIAALDIINYVDKNNLPISINYCSLKYKMERKQYLDWFKLRNEYLNE